MFGEALGQHARRGSIISAGGMAVREAERGWAGRGREAWGRTCVAMGWAVSRGGQKEGGRLEELSLSLSRVCLLFPKQAQASEIT